MKRSPHIAILLLLVCSLLRKIDDFDIWYHLAIGREIFRTFRIPAVELFVYPLLGTPVSYHEWGFGLLFYSVYRLAGYWAISLLNALLGASAMYFVYRALEGKDQSRIDPAALLTLCGVFWTIQFRVIYRPEIMLFVFLGAAIYVLECFERTGDIVILFLLPIFSGLLDNFHPSAIFLCAVICFYSVHFMIHPPAGWMKRKKLFAVLLALNGATFIAGIMNPYGLAQLLLPIKFVAQQNVLQDVVEFLPTFQTVYKWPFVMLTLAGATALALQPRRRVVDVLLFFSFGYLGYKYVRNVALFAFVMYVPITRTAMYYAERFQPSHVVARRLLWGLASVLAGVMLAYPIITHNAGSGFHEDLVPVQGAQVIKRISPPGQIFNFYHTGGFLAWQLYDYHYRVFIDGRHYTRDESWDLHDEVFLAEPDWKTILDRYNVNVIITPSTLPFSNKIIPLVTTLAEDPDWQLVSAEPGGLTFLRGSASRETGIAPFLDKDAIWQQIITESERTLHQNPSNANSYYSMAEAYIRLKKYANASLAFRNYLAINPGDENALQILSILKTLESGRDSQPHSS